MCVYVCVCVGGGVSRHRLSLTHSRGQPVALSEVSHRRQSSDNVGCVCPDAIYWGLPLDADSVGR